MQKYHTRTKVRNSKGKPDLLCFSRFHDRYNVSVSFVPPAAMLYCIWELKNVRCVCTMCLRLNGNILFLSHQIFRFSFLKEFPLILNMLNNNV